MRQAVGVNIQMQVLRQLPGTFIFCFGSNHPVSFAKMLGTTVPEFLGRSISAVLPAYGRVFVGLSPSWGNCSFANIIAHPKSEVEGYAVKLRPEDVSKLDTSIGYPKMYSRTKIQMKRLPYKEGDELVEGETYIYIDKNFLSKYKRPTPEYLDATCKTLSASLYLRTGAYEDNVHQLKLKVHKQSDVSQDLIHEAFASMKYLGL